MSCGCKNDRPATSRVCNPEVYRCTDYCGSGLFLEKNERSGSPTAVDFVVNGTRTHYDLGWLVKAGETVTNLQLNTEPRQLVFNSEDGVDIIDLASIFGMFSISELKDGGNIDIVKTLTTADYNYPTDNPMMVALWLLDEGVYKRASDDVQVRFDRYHDAYAEDFDIYVVTNNLEHAGNKNIKMFGPGNLHLVGKGFNAYVTSELRPDGSIPYINCPQYALVSGQIREDLETQQYDYVLDASQGKVLKDMIGDLTDLDTTDKNDLVSAVNELVDTKVDKVAGKQLSTEDYTTAEKTKLAGIEDGAEVNDPNTVIDANYVHTDNNYTTAEKNKLAGLENYDDTEVRGLISTEASDRALADNNLQSQIDVITSSSDVVDVVGTYAELLAYDTQYLNDKDIVKVLVDESRSNVISYYRWSTSSQTWSYIGSQGPFYTKSESDTLLNGKVDKVTGKGLSTNDYTTSDKTKLTNLADIQTIGTGLSLSGGELSATSSGPTVVQTTGTSVTDVMSQNAVTGMVYADTSTKQKVQLGNAAHAHGNYTTCIGNAWVYGTGAAYFGGSDTTGTISGNNAVGLGSGTQTSSNFSVAIGAYSTASGQGVVSFGGVNLSNRGYNNSNYRLLTDVYDGVNAHDAVTKGQMDTAIAGVTINEINSTDWSDLWQ